MLYTIQPRSIPEVNGMLYTIHPRSIPVVSGTLYTIHLRSTGQGIVWLFVASKFLRPNFIRSTAQALQLVRCLRNNWDPKFRCGLLDSMRDAMNVGNHAGPDIFSMVVFVRLSSPL